MNSGVQIITAVISVREECDCSCKQCCAGGLYAMLLNSKVLHYYFKTSFQLSLNQFDPKEGGNLTLTVILCVITLHPSPLCELLNTKRDIDPLSPPFLLKSIGDVD